MTLLRMPILVLVAALSAPISLHAETPDEWIALGARVHGGFGSFIPVGIRIGLNALASLNATPREVTVATTTATRPRVHV